jgi:hypothetical protein
MTEQEILIDRINNNWLTKNLKNTGNDLILEAGKLCTAKDMELGLGDDCFKFILEYIDRNKKSNC